MFNILSYGARHSMFTHAMFFPRVCRPDTMDQRASRWETVIVPIAQATIRAPNVDSLNAWSESTMTEGSGSCRIYRLLGCIPLNRCHGLSTGRNGCTLIWRGATSGLDSYACFSINRRDAVAILCDGGRPYMGRTVGALARVLDADVRDPTLCRYTVQVPLRPRVTAPRLSSALEGPDDIAQTGSAKTSTTTKLNEPRAATTVSGIFHDKCVRFSTNTEQLCYALACMSLSYSATAPLWEELETEATAG